MRRLTAGLAALAALTSSPPARGDTALPVAPTLTSTALESSGPSVFGEAVTFTATTTVGGVPVATGTVDFLLTGLVPIAGCSDVPVVAPGGTAQCVTDDLPVAPLGQIVTARYDAAIPGLDGVVHQVVGRAPITVSAPSRAITYGRPLPTDLAPAVSGTAATLVTGTPVCAISGAPKNAGVYDDAITCASGTLDAANFLYTFAPGDLTIARAPATVTANPVTMTAGEALPQLTATVAGLIGDDTIDVTCKGPAMPPSAAGTYTDALTCLADPLNYAVTLVHGTLTVLAPVLGPVTGGNTIGPGGGGSTTTNNTTTNVTIVGGGGAQPPAMAKAPALSLLTKKLKGARRARLKLSSTGAMAQLKLVLKRNGKSVARGALARLNGPGSATVKARRKLKKGLYTLEATWVDDAGRKGKKRFNVRVR